MIRLLLIALLATAASAQGIPKELWGKWVVKRQLDTTTISCWGDKEARGLIGTEIEYKAATFRWGKVTTEKARATVRSVTSQQFHDENSGGGANSSQVTFEQLGIRAANAKLVTIEHAPAAITGSTIEIPGDALLVKSRDSIIFSVCNVYFEARRKSAVR
jgi:hypothetical protein